MIRGTPRCDTFLARPDIRSRRHEESLTRRSTLPSILSRSFLRSSAQSSCRLQMAWHLHQQDAAEHLNAHLEPKVDKLEVSSFTCMSPKHQQLKQYEEFQLTRQKYASRPIFLDASASMLNTISYSAHWMAKFQGW